MSMTWRAQWPGGRPAHSVSDCGVTVVTSLLENIKFWGEGFFVVDADHSLHNLRLKTQPLHTLLRCVAEGTGWVLAQEGPTLKLSGLQCVKASEAAAGSVGVQVLLGPMRAVCFFDFQRCDVPQEECIN